MTAPINSIDRPLLTAVLDRLIPAGAGFPGAGAVAVDHVLRVLDRDGAMLAAFAEGLAVIAGEGGDTAFGALPEAEQDAALRRVEAAHPAFFDLLVTHTYGGYYSNPVVLAALGLDAGPPHPRGHILEPTDWSILDRVRAMPKLWRD